jgi:hypothetical protein
MLHGLQVWAPPVRAALPARMHRPVENAGVIDTGLVSPSSGRGVWSATATAFPGLKVIGYSVVLPSLSLRQSFQHNLSPSY